jgi:hypothetical protein
VALVKSKSEQVPVDREEQLDPRLRMSQYQLRHFTIIIAKDPLAPPSLISLKHDKHDAQYLVQGAGTADLPP